MNRQPQQPQDPNDPVLRGEVAYQIFRRFSGIEFDVERVPGTWERGSGTWALYVRTEGRWHLIGRRSSLAELVELAKTFELPRAPSAASGATPSTPRPHVPKSNMPRTAL